VPSARSPYVALALAVVVGAALVYGTIDLPPFGAADTPPNQHVAPFYLQNSIPQTTVPNVVTSVLASYRGFDTFGETVVVFTAGLGVLLLLRGRPKPREATVDQSDEDVWADDAEKPGGEGRA
ncbi:MAG: hydrogen gas-evolving membrane-bound hydrogenase subunit E, partial [Pseudomonadota bacterium]